MHFIVLEIIFWFVLTIIINNAKLYAFLHHRWKTQQDGQEVDTRFKQRVGDIAFWKSELEGKLADLKREIEAVECKHIRIAAGLGATSEPLGIAEKCIANRGQMVGVDRCDDNVNKHLQVLKIYVKKLH